VRTNRDGTLFTSNYAEVTSLALDPIEKKPLYHFHPGSLILSVGTFGCNLKCAFCQNWQISQQRPETRIVPPSELARLAEEQVPQGNIGVAYTYNEPFIWYEYIRETAPLVKAAGLHNVLVTNGIVEAEPLAELLPFVDAMNVDIKSMSERFYLEHCAGQGLPARQTVERAWEHCLVEVTNLLIPGQNDSEADVQALVDWLAGLSPDIPLHFSAYHPDYQFDAPPTPVATLERACELARAKLKYVYAGNTRVPDASDTRCPDCGATVVTRQGMAGQATRLTVEGRCEGCGADLNLHV
jgi:pyruvate formate lyase activating enzyme